MPESRRFGYYFYWTRCSYKEQRTHLDQLEAMRPLVRMIETAARKTEAPQEAVMSELQEQLKLGQFTSGKEIKAMCRNTNQSTSISVFVPSSLRWRQLLAKGRKSSPVWSATTGWYLSRIDERKEAS